MRHYLMEFLGTFLLTLAVSSASDPMTIGLILMAAIYMGIHISGAHYNPAITTTALVRGMIDIREAIIYMSSQLVGAVTALWFNAFVTGKAWFPEQLPEGFGIGPSVFMETLFTFILCMVVLNVAMSKRYKGTMLHGLIIGLTIGALVGLGGVMNPAVSGGAMLCGMLNQTAGFSSMNNIMIYIAGPLAGGAIAAIAYQYLNPSEK